MERNYTLLRLTNLSTLTTVFGACD